MAMAFNPNYDIYIATKAGDLDRVKYLVEVEDVNINRMDDHNSVPLFYACLCGHRELVRYLLDRGARLEAGTFVAERCYYGALNDEITHLLKNYKAKPESTDHLAERLRAILNDGFASDVTFVVENREINAHRFVLTSRCPYFVKEFNGRWKDKSRVPLVHSSIRYEAFHALMEYIYTGQVNFDIDFYDSFMVLCRQCKLHSLKATVESEYQMAQTKKHSRIIIKPPVYHVTGSPLYRDMRQALKYIVHEQATKSSLSSSLSELTPTQTTFTDICLLVQEVPEQDEETNTRSLKSSVNLHCFYSHRALLYSHSEYFKVMFSGQFVESTQIDKQNPYVELKDISPHIMKLVLEFIYTYHVEFIPNEYLLDLLAAAGLFLLPQLKKLCVNQIIRLLTKDNVFTYLYAADVLQAAKLRDACYDIIEPNIEKFYKSPELEEFLLEGDKEAVTHLKHVIEDYEEHLEWYRQDNP